MLCVYGTVTMTLIQVVPSGLHLRDERTHDLTHHLAAPRILRSSFPIFSSHTYKIYFMLTPHMVT